MHTFRLPEFLKCVKNYLNKKGKYRPSVRPLYTGILYGYTGPSSVKCQNEARTIHYYYLHSTMWVLDAQYYIDCDISVNTSLRAIWYISLVCRLRV